VQNPVRALVGSLWKKGVFRMGVFEVFGDTDLGGADELTGGKGYEFS
jgi:hypothetical protein